MRPRVSAGVRALEDAEQHALGGRRHGARRNRRRHERQVHEPVDALAARERVRAVEVERVEPAELQDELVLEDLRAVEAAHLGVRARRFGKEQRRARGDERAAREERHIARPHLDVSGDGESFPQQLAQVALHLDVELAAVVEAAIVVTVGDPVEELRIADVDLGALLAHLRPRAAPVAKELAALEERGRWRRRSRRGCRAACAAAGAVPARSARAAAASHLPDRATACLKTTLTIVCLPLVASRNAPGYAHDSEQSSSWHPRNVIDRHDISRTDWPVVMLASPDAG